MGDLGFRERGYPELLLLLLAAAFGFFKFSYTEHLLRQRPSSPTTTISCPLRLVPFEAAADKGPWLSSSWSTLYYLRKIRWFHKVRYIVGVYVGLVDEADLRAVSERPSGTTCCHPSSVVCHLVPHYQFR
ncbi:hypothetical protein HKD37_06G016205 [Glycine soja]